MEINVNLNSAVEGINETHRAAKAQAVTSTATQTQQQGAHIIEDGLRQTIELRRELAAIEEQHRALSTSEVSLQERLNQLYAERARLEKIERGKNGEMGSAENIGATNEHAEISRKVELERNSLEIKQLEMVKEQELSAKREQLLSRIQSAEEKLQSRSEAKLTTQERINKLREREAELSSQISKETDTDKKLELTAEKKETEVSRAGLEDQKAVTDAAKIESLQRQRADHARRERQDRLATLSPEERMAQLTAQRERLERYIAAARRQGNQGRVEALSLRRSQVDSQIQTGSRQQQGHLAQMAENLLNRIPGMSRVSSLLGHVQTFTGGGASGGGVGGGSIIGGIRNLFGGGGGGGGGVPPVISGAGAGGGGAAGSLLGVAGKFVAVGAVVVAALAAIGFAAKKFVETVFESMAKARQIDKLANRLDMTRADTQRLVRAGGDTDLGPEALMGAIEGIKIHQAEALDGNADLVASFQKLGFSIKDLQELSSGDIFFRLAESFKDGKISGDQLAASIKVMGRSGKEVAAALKEGLADKLDKSVLDASPESLETLNTAAKEWKEFTSTISDAISKVKMEASAFAISFAKLFSGSSIQGFLASTGLLGKDAKGKQADWEAQGYAGLFMGGTGEDAVKAAELRAQQKKAARDNRKKKESDEAVAGGERELALEQKIEEQRIQSLAPAERDAELTKKIAQLKAEISGFENADPKLWSEEILQRRAKLGDAEADKGKFDDNKREEHMAGEDRKLGLERKLEERKFKALTPAKQEADLTERIAKLRREIAEFEAKADAAKDPELFRESKLEAQVKMGELEDEKKQLTDNKRQSWEDGQKALGRTSNATDSLARIGGQLGGQNAALQVAKDQLSAMRDLVKGMRSNNENTSNLRPS